MAEATEDLEIDVPEMQRRLRQGGVTVVDVLPRAAYEAEHVPGSLSLPLSELATHARELLPDLSAPIITYCAGFT